MSELRVDSVKSKGGGAPNLPKGVTISGIATATTLGATTIDVSNVNVSGVVTSATLNGPLLSTGTPTLGLGVTINSSGVAISGVATAGIVSATTLFGDGTNITGVGATLAPLFYQPDPYDTGVSFPAGIGITFNQQVKAGTGNVTLSIANAGVAGTVVENFGVGSSVSISENRITINPTADLSEGQDYIISYPSGCFTNNEGSDYVGTAYTFQARVYEYQLFAMGSGDYGGTGQNNRTTYSSPVQIPGLTWSPTKGELMDTGSDNSLMTKTDGTLWSWGVDYNGNLGHNGNGANAHKSSPTQIPGTNWTVSIGGNLHSLAVKDDGTLWGWGRNGAGQLGLNSRTLYSSPVQIPGTTWDYVNGDGQTGFAKKTDGTLWCWGNNEDGGFGNNESETRRSSPVQIPGTWSGMKGMSCSGNRNTAAIKSDSTLWAWGRNDYGNLGQNDRTQRSSPVQIPGTTWKEVRNISTKAVTAIKTDGTLWSWGFNDNGALGQNQAQPVAISSPTQLGSGTDWDKLGAVRDGGVAIKTDGSLYVWGRNDKGQLGLNNVVYYSSPVQVPGNWNAFSNAYSGFDGIVWAIKKV